MHIPRTKVESSQIEAIGYHHESQSLDVEFVKRKPDAPTSVYRYTNVPPHVHADLIAAESIGKHFGEYVKKLPGTYPYRKLTPEEINPTE